MSTELQERVVYSNEDRYKGQSVVIPKINLADLEARRRWSRYSPAFAKTERAADYDFEIYREIEDLFQLIFESDGEANIDLSETEYVNRNISDFEKALKYSCLVRTIQSSPDVREYASRKLTEEEKQIAERVVEQYDGTNYSSLVFKAEMDYNYFIGSYTVLLLTDYHEKHYKGGAKSIGVFPYDDW